MTSRDSSGWLDSGRNSRGGATAVRDSAQDGPRDAADLLAPKTQIVTDRDAYLGQGKNDVGRRISDDQVELFISGDVANSLQLEFTQHAPDFLALHDVGTSASLRLLNSLAGAAGARVQKLSIRRQGHGVALAVLQFVEMPLADGTPVRVYSSDLNSNGQTRAQVARVLLGFSRLGVLLVGELPPHAVTQQLSPLHDAIVRGPWPNRELLLLPLASTSALAAQSTQLAARSQVAVHVTPHAASPRQAWSFIGGAWNRLHAGGNHGVQSAALPTELAQAVPKRKLPRNEMATQPMGLASDMPAKTAAANPAPPVLPRPAPPAPLPPGYALPAALAGAAMPAPVAMPAAPARTTPLSVREPMPMPAPGGVSWQSYADRCALIKGTIACCVFDAHSRQALAMAGGPPGGDRLAQQGASLLSQVADSARSLGLSTSRLEVAASTSSHHLIVRPVPGHSGIALHMVLLASTANLTLARMQLERIEIPE
jgi:hypothetical protein